jgi:hypothetical protein
MVPPAWIRGGEVKQLERARESKVKSGLVSRLMRADRAIDFAADVGELFHQGKLAPPAGRGGRVDWGRSGRGHASLTRSLTTATMASRTAALSTPRLRFPADGRTLIIESYSIQPAPLSSG